MPTASLGVIVRPHFKPPSVSSLVENRKRQVVSSSAMNRDSPDKLSGKKHYTADLPAFGTGDDASCPGKLPSISGEPRARPDHFVSHVRDPIIDGEELRNVRLRQQRRTDMLYTSDIRNDDLNYIRQKKGCPPSDPDRAGMRTDHEEPTDRCGKRIIKCPSVSGKDEDFVPHKRILPQTVQQYESNPLIPQKQPASISHPSKRMVEEYSYRHPSIDSLIPDSNSMPANNASSSRLAVPDLKEKISGADSGTRIFGIFSGGGGGQVDSQHSRIRTFSVKNAESAKSLLFGDAPCPPMESRKATQQQYSHDLQNAHRERVAGQRAYEIARARGESSSAGVLLKEIIVDSRRPPLPPTLGFY